MKHPKSYDSTAETRKRMSHVKLKKGYEEVVLAKALWHKGYRYRLNYKGLPGSPDIAIIKYNHIENPNLLATKIIVPHQLIVRESCCPPPEV